MPTKGVEEFAGVGLVKHGKWCEARWKQYRKLMNRTHNMIVGVTIAEKAEGAKQLTIFKATRGYDPTKWVKANATIRSEEKLMPEYQSIEISQPTMGKHKFMHCQVLYEQVHAFLVNRKWAPVSNDDEVSGITWIELFALFDFTGERTEKGQHQKDPETVKGAEKES